MYTLLRILFLTLVWCALQGTFAPVTVVLGAVVGGGVLLFVQPLYEDEVTDWKLSSAVHPQTAVARLKRVVWFFDMLAYFVYALVLSSLQVARAILTPNMNLSPGVIAIELDESSDSDLEIMTLANLISLTPGTLSLEVSSDKQVLYIHSMFLDGEEAGETRAYIKRTLERRVIRALGTPREAEAAQREEEQKRAQEAGGEKPSPPGD